MDKERMYHSGFLGLSNASNQWKFTHRTALLALTATAYACTAKVTGFLCVHVNAEGCREHARGICFACVRSTRGDGAAGDSEASWAKQTSMP